MILRLLYLCLGLLGTVPLLYMIRIGGSYDSSHYQYAAVGLFAGLFGFLFGLNGLIFGAAFGFIGFKIKENKFCDCIDFFVRKVKPLVKKIPYRIEK